MVNCVLVTPEQLIIKIYNYYGMVTTQQLTFLTFSCYGVTTTQITNKRHFNVYDVFYSLNVFRVILVLL